MNRRSFMKNIGKVVAGVLVVPLFVKAESQKIAIVKSPQKRKALKWRRWAHLSTETQPLVEGSTYKGLTLKERYEAMATRDIAL